jgi:hypothetical protein
MTTSPIEDERLDRLLAELDPGRSFATTAVAIPLEALALRLENPDARNEAETELRRPNRRTRVRRIRWTIAGLLVVILGVFGGIPAAAAVEQWLAHTHLYGANFSTTRSDATSDSEADDSEWIGLNAPDVNKALASLYPSYLVFPKGITKDDAIRTIIGLNKSSIASDQAGAAHVLGQVSLVHETYESFATCAWYGDWLIADSAQDNARLQADDAGLATAVEFPATAQASPTIIPFERKLAEGAANGSRADVEKGYQADACADFMKGLTP